MQITEKIKKEILKFLKRTRKADLILTYLYYVEQKNNLKPVLFIREKKIYQSLENYILSTGFQALFHKASNIFPKTHKDNMTLPI